MSFSINRHLTQTDIKPVQSMYYEQGLFLEAGKNDKLFSTVLDSYFLLSSSKCQHFYNIFNLVSAEASILQHGLQVN